MLNAVTYSIIFACNMVFAYGTIISLPGFDYPNTYEQNYYNDNKNKKLPNQLKNDVFIIKMHIIWNSIIANEY